MTLPDRPSGRIAALACTIGAIILITAGGFTVLASLGGVR